MNHGLNTSQFKRLSVVFLSEAKAPFDPSMQLALEQKEHFPSGVMG